MSCGIYAPQIQSIITQDTFRHCRIFVHLSGVITPNHRVTSRYDPLAKIHYVMKKIMNSLRLDWIFGIRITINESMIKYSGRAVSFIQYMPKKSIKYGIHVFFCVVHVLVIYWVVRYVLGRILKQQKILL